MRATASTLPMTMLLLAASLTACNATPPNTDTSAPAAQTTAQSTTSAAPTDAAATNALPPGAAGKISADMAGKISPVAAMMGHGKDFEIEIHADDDVKDGTTDNFGHRVQLVLGKGAMRREGVLFYRGPKPAPSEQPIVLEGQLDGSPKPISLRVEILRKACVDDTGQSFPHAVVLTVGLGPQGKGMRMYGCAELAMY